MSENTRQLVQLIHDRGFKPGDKLPSEREMSEMFGMSRSAVREALIRLDTLRIIDSRPKSGIFLRGVSTERSIEAMVLFAEADTPLAAEEVIQSVELRRLFECQAIRLACERRTDEDLGRLASIIQRSVDALHDGLRISQFDADFHCAIVSATQNDVFVRFVNVFYLMSRKRRNTYFSVEQNRRRSIDDHRKLLAAIASRDTAGAELLMGQHIKGVDVYFRTLFGSEDTSMPKQANRTASRRASARSA